jgi:hypothetical protein
MTRTFRRLLPLSATALAVVGLTAASAQAKVLHVTGKQSTLTPSAAVTSVITKYHVTVTAVGPATITNGSLTLPISGGHVNSKNLNGTIVHTGGVKFTIGKHSVVLRSFVAGHVGSQTLLTANVGTTRVVIARLTDIKRTITGTQAVITGQLNLSADAAHRINARIGHHVVSAGADLGTFDSTVTVS